MREQGRAAPTCHCEPARTLARQSVLFGHVTTHPVGCGDTGRCGQKVNCPAGAREATLGCRPLRGMGRGPMWASAPTGCRGDMVRCGQKVNCPAGAREATLGCRPLRGGWGTREQGRAAPTCHCEPARTLARQSVLLVHVTTHPVGRGGIRADVVDIGPYGGAGDTGIRADEGRR